MRFGPKLCVLIIGLIVANAPVRAEDPSETNVTISGYASIEAGQVVKGYSFNYNNINGVIDHGWIERSFIGLRVTKVFDKQLKMIVGAEGMLNSSFNVGQRLNDQYLETQRPLLKFSIWHGEGIYSFGDTQRVSFQVEAGYFPYKYNPDARNFGEYLFRTGCYPGIILNKFDRPYADLLGVRIGNSIAGRFHHDLFFTSEITEFFFPPNDFSLSYLASYTVPGVFEGGIGGSLYRLFSVNTSRTAPKNQETQFKVTNVRTETDQFGNPVTVGDTSNLSFAGAKILCRFSFDIKGVFPMDFLGKEDLKLYAEAAVLGLKNYRNDLDTSKNYYDNLAERIPLAIGFNVPAWRFLDVLNLELEYYNSNFPNSFFNAFKQQNPIPDKENPLAVHEKLKWSIYAKKTIRSNVRIIGQVANDHVIPTSHVLTMGLGSQDFQDVVLRHGDWWWTLKMAIDF